MKLDNYQFVRVIQSYAVDDKVLITPDLSSKQLMVTMHVYMLKVRHPIDV